MLKLTIVFFLGMAYVFWSVYQNLIKSKDVREDWRVLVVCILDEILIGGTMIFMMYVVWKLKSEMF